MRVLVACEYSGIVRRAFAKRGHHAVSCDLLPTEDQSWEGRQLHQQRDVREILDCGWDLMIAHPPCTHLAVSGARWFKDKQVEQAEALEFVKLLLDAPIPRIALENPVSIISSRIRKPDQIIQPWQFGHGETKATCLWLKGLPKLWATCLVNGREARVHKMAPSPDRPVEREKPNIHGHCKRNGQPMGRSMMRSEYAANRHLAASAGLSTTKWREPRDLTVLGAHPTYWMALGLTLIVAVLL